MNKLDDLLANFESVLEQQITKVWEAKNLPINLVAMANGMGELSSTIIEIGDFCFEQLNDKTNKLADNELFNYYWIDFECSALTKSLMVLWRDILFQQQKGQIIRMDNLTTAEALRTLNLQSQEILYQAVYDLKGDIERAFSFSAKTKEKKIAEWQLQQNPWPNYKKQFQAFPEQGLRLQSEFEKLLNIATNYQEIEALVQQTESFCHKEIEEIKKNAEQTAAEIEKKEIPNLGKIALHLEDLEAGISLPHHFNTFTDTLDNRINALTPKIEVPVATNGGMVAIKDLNFRRNSKQWLDAEILPLLYEVWELTENAHNGLKMALINIKNRVILLSAEEKEGKTIDLKQEAICQPLKTFTKNLIESESSLEDLRILIKQRMAKDFNVSAIYETEREFLPIPLQSSLNQFRQNQNKVQDEFSRWFQKQWRRLQNIKETVEQEDLLSDSEKIVRLIKNRIGDPNNANYSSIFLTKGFIGESFAVGRTQELAHAKSLIDNWKMGFRGSLVITGQRFSGKTLLGELIANQFFDSNTVRLAPNTLIKLNGRRMTTNFDLAPALEFIRKYTSNKPPLIWIDDLELWWDVNLPLSQNVRTLRKYIDNYSNRLFFMVSMSNWLKAQLNLFHETSKIFQAEINIDRMPIQEIRNAILIRHGATHKKLVNKSGEAVNSTRLRKMMDCVYRAADGNVGEALNRWSFSNKKIDENLVFHQSDISYNLPDFLNPDSAILLASIMMEKRTNEYRLRKLYGPAFTDKYSTILQRLISIGLLTRELDGWLEINEVVVNDLGRLLETKGYLKFHR